MGIADEIAKLKQLHDAGTLSAQDYESAKARVLAGDTGGSAPGTVAGSSELLPNLMLLLPLAGLVVLWFAWDRISGSFSLFEARTVIDGAKNLTYTAAGVAVIGTMFLVAIDASNLGFGKDSAPATSSAQRGPVGWAFLVLVLWVISFPAYLHARSVLAPKARRLTSAAIAVSLLFLGGTAAVSWRINERTDQVEDRVRDIRKGLEDTKKAFDDARQQTRRLFEQ